MNQIGWMLVAIGLAIVGLGLVWVLAPSVGYPPPRVWLGRLPGDIRIEGENTRIYIPITTCLLLSLVLTGVAWLIRYFSR